MTTTATTTAPVLAVTKDGKDFIVTNEAGEVLARATTRREAREAKAEIEAEALLPAETPESAEAEFVAEVEGSGRYIDAVIDLIDEVQAEVDAAAEEEEEWVPAADDTTEDGEAPAASATEVVPEVKVEKAKKVVCSGSSSYVGYWDEDVTEFTKKGKPAWALTNCPGCNTKVRAGIWFTEKGEALNGDRGLAYLPKH